MISVDSGMTTRWKINTRFENWLGHKADKSDLFKKLYCKYYAIFDKDYYKKGIEMARQTMENFHAYKLYGRGYNEDEILQDMIYCLHRFGFIYQEYFYFELYKKDARGKREYVSDKMRLEYYCKLNTKEGISLLRDKGKTYELLKKYFKRECVAVYSISDSLKFQKFIGKHIQFIYKPIGEGLGKGVKKIDATGCSTELLCINLLKDGAFIAEEIISQSEIIAKFHRQSVNTVRLFTMNCKDDIYVIHSSFFKMGRGESVVDNASAGNIFASVDINSGVVISRGVIKKKEGQYIYHPDTKEKILGFQMPDWDKAIHLIKEMAVLVKGVKCVAWDLAYTNDGWVLVEANGTGMLSSQIADRIGVRREFLGLMKKAL